LPVLKNAGTWVRDNDLQWLTHKPAKEVYVMAGESHNTVVDRENRIKIEAFAAIQRVKEILSGLAAITIIRMQAAGGSDHTPAFWRDVYKTIPWGPNSGEPNGILPACLDEEMNQMILRQLGEAWSELDEKAELVFGLNFQDKKRDLLSTHNGKNY